MSEADRVPLPGEIFAGKYRIERTLGEGGMGVVLGAVHVHLDDRVAIKFLRPELASDGTFVQRFLREGRASIKIRSEHVVRVLDVATMPGGTPFMVMEYLDGSNLEDLVKREGRLAVSTTVDYLLQAMEAIAEAHALGMVHRDLKPANLFLVRRADGSPSVKVLDFGITKVTPAAGSTGGTLGMTKTNAVMGSPRYMSPEQMRSTRTVDARADIWAIGVIIYELLVGAPPFEATTMPELVAAIVSDPTPPLRAARPDAPPELEAIVTRCMEKEPARRFANVSELAAALAPLGSTLAKSSAERISRVLRLSSTPSVTPPVESRAAPHTRTSQGVVAPAATLDETKSTKSSKAGVVIAGVVVMLAIAGVVALRASRATTTETITAPSAPLVAAVMTPPPDPMAPITDAAVVDATTRDAAIIDAAAPSAPPSATSTASHGHSHAPPSPAKPAPAKPSSGDDLFDGRH